MAIFQAFRALRPVPDKAAQVAALPYDVVTREEAKLIGDRNPDSFLHVDRAEMDLPENTDLYDPKVYDKARENLADMERNGVMIQDETPCYYIYELTMEGRAQTGIVALSSIDDYLNGICKKHENTVEEKEQDRIRHVDTCSAQTGPIFLAYRAHAGIQAIVEEVKKEAALYDFVTDDGVGHRVWRIADSERVAALEALFEKVPATYIADGHHRAASAVKVGLRRREAHPDYDGSEEFNYFLSVLFPDKELKIMDYNRVVKDLHGMDPEDFMFSVEEDFQVFHLTQPISPKVKGEICMYLGGEWFLLRARAELLSARSIDPVKALDVSLLQDTILGPLLGIGDPRTDKRIEFVGGIRGLRELEKRVSQHTYAHAMDGSLEELGPAVAFAMHPTGITELLDVADHHLLMPPKSTWFEPKLRSGIFIHEIER